MPFDLMLDGALPGLLPTVVICVLVFLAGFVDSIAGGGGLISLPAYLFAGLPVHNAIATNKMSSCMGTAVATWRYARCGYIPWKMAAFCVVAALAGGSLGAAVALAIPEGLFLLFMLVALPPIAFYVLRGKAFDDERERYSTRKATLLGMGIAFGIGVYDGVYGPGTGTFLILLLTGLAHLTLDEANGVTKAINLATNASALAVFLLGGKTLIVLGLLAGAFSIGGNYVGARLFTKVGAASVRPIMIVVIVLFFIKLVVELVGLL